MNTKTVTTLPANLRAGDVFEGLTLMARPRPYGYRPEVLMLVRDAAGGESWKIVYRWGQVTVSRSI